MHQVSILPVNLRTISGYALKGQAKGTPSRLIFSKPARVGDSGSAVTTRWGLIPLLINFLYGLLLATIMALSCISLRKSIDSSKEGPAPTKINGISGNSFFISPTSGECAT